MKELIIAIIDALHQIQYSPEDFNIGDEYAYILDYGSKEFEIKHTKRNYQKMTKDINALLFNILNQFNGKLQIEWDEDSEMTAIILFVPKSILNFNISQLLKRE